MNSLTPSLSLTCQADGNKDMFVGNCIYYYCLLTLSAKRDVVLSLLSSLSLSLSLSLSPSPSPSLSLPLSLSPSLPPSLPPSSSPSLPSSPSLLHYNTKDNYQLIETTC